MTLPPADEGGSPTGPPVALVSMPTVSARFPSFQLALLQPTLERAGHAVECFSLFLEFARGLGWRANEAVAGVRPCMIGEWLFAKEAFGAFADDAAYLEEHREDLAAVCREARIDPADLVRIRDRVVPAFLDRMLESTDWSRFCLIGFTVVFQQMLPTLAFARRLKARYPDVPIILGGGAFETSIAREVLRGCPAVDYVHASDADETLPEIVRRIKADAPLGGQPGLLHRGPGGAISFAGRAPNLADLDRTPCPDFDEYFRRSRSTGYTSVKGRPQVMLPIETARGCWWGEKAHCTFCGLNRAGMAFRAKSPDAVLRMLDRLSRRYGVLSFNAIDNILDPAYVEGLFGRLREARSDLRLHYEIRANLGREALRGMWEGGLRSVQPGVESFSTRVLKRMRKGTRGIENLELVKWCTYYGIDNLYNILYGFHGETADDYAQQLELCRRLRHLQPPYAFARARPDRGSPMFEAPGENGVRDLRPTACYRHLFPPDRFDLPAVAYYFDHAIDGALPESVYAPLQAEVRAWKAAWARRPRPFLHYRKGLGVLTVEDGRRGAVRRTALRDEAAALYEFLEDARTNREIATRFGAEPWIEQSLTRFDELRISARLDRCTIALALPVHRGH